MNKQAKLIEYMNQYTPFSDKWLYLNVVIGSVSETGLVLDAITVIDEYIDGTKRKEYVFNVEMCKDYSTDEDGTNQTAISEYENLVRWVEQQADSGNYPDWDVNFRNIEVLNELPALTVDSEHNRAIYTSQIKITYEE